MAFRGESGDWYNFDPRRNLDLKLAHFYDTMHELFGEDDERSCPPKVKFNNGFESQVPSGVLGGQRFGKPETKLEAELKTMRYPTMQRVSHSFPADPMWRSHVQKSIRVLERGKGWDFGAKLRAINTMKEVYEDLNSSEAYRKRLDRMLPYDRPPSRFIRGNRFVQRFPKFYKNRKRRVMYHRSLTKK